MNWLGNMKQGPYHAPEVLIDRRAYGDDVLMNEPQGAVILSKSSLSLNTHGVRATRELERADSLVGNESMQTGHIHPRGPDRVSKERLKVIVVHCIWSDHESISEVHHALREFLEAKVEVCDDHRDDCCIEFHKIFGLREQVNGSDSIVDWDLVNIFVYPDVPTRATGFGNPAAEAAVAVRHDYLPFAR